MRLIEIQDGISIDVDRIEAIVKVDNNKCIIHIGSSRYESTIYSYETLMSMISSGKLVTRDITKDQQFSSTMKKLDGVLGTMGHFAG